MLDILNISWTNREMPFFGGKKACFSELQLSENKIQAQKFNNVLQDGNSSEKSDLLFRFQAQAYMLNFSA